MTLITTKEFRDEGYLLEVNRRFFHPLGLALSVDYPDEGDDPSGITSMNVIDYRDDPEGVWMALDDNDVARGQKVREIELIRASERRTRLGFWVQPLEFRTAKGDASRKS